MNSFEAAGEAQLLAIKGQRQIAAALAGLVKTAFNRFLSALARRAPGLRNS